MSKYNSPGFKSVSADSMTEAAEIFANRRAKRDYGRGCGRERENMTYTVTAGEAATQIEAESPEQAAALATPKLKESLSVNTSHFPSDLTVHDEKTGRDYGFTL